MISLWVAVKDAGGVRVFECDVVWMLLGSFFPETSR